MSHYEIEAAPPESDNWETAYENCSSLADARTMAPAVCNPAFRWRIVKVSRVIVEYDTGVAP